VRGLSSHFTWTNRSKESLTLDLKHEQATDIMIGCLARADVLVQKPRTRRRRAHGPVVRSLA